MLTLLFELLLNPKREAPEDVKKVSNMLGKSSFTADWDFADIYQRLEQEEDPKNADLLQKIQVLKNHPDTVWDHITQCWKTVKNTMQPDPIAESLIQCLSQKHEWNVQAIQNKNVPKIEICTWSFLEWISALSSQLNMEIDLTCLKRFPLLPTILIPKFFPKLFQAFYPIVQNHLAGWETSFSFPFDMPEEEVMTDEKKRMSYYPPDIYFCGLLLVLKLYEFNPETQSKMQYKYERMAQIYLERGLENLVSVPLPIMQIRWYQAFHPFITQFASFLQKECLFIEPYTPELNYSKLGKIVSFQEADFLLPPSPPLPRKRKTSNLPKAKRAPKKKLSKKVQKCKNMVVSVYTTDHNNSFVRSLIDLLWMETADARFLSEQEFVEMCNETQKTKYLQLKRIAKSSAHTSVDETSPLFAFCCSQWEPLLSNSLENLMLPDPVSRYLCFFRQKSLTADEKVLVTCLDQERLQVIQGKTCISNVEASQNGKSIR